MSDNFAVLRSGFASADLVAAALAVAALAISGCVPGGQRVIAAEGKAAQTGAQPVLEGDSARYKDAFGGRASDHPGATHFQAACAQCHLGQVAKAPHRDMLQLMSGRSILSAMTKGAMVSQASALDDAQKTSIAEYLSGAPLAAAAPASHLACGSGARGFDLSRKAAWGGWGVDAQNSHRIPATAAGIGRENLSTLTLKWAFAFPEATRVRSQPVVGGGSLFVGGHDGAVYAIDQKTGCLKWKFEASAEVRTGIVIGDWDAGDADAVPTLYFGDFLGDVYAVDARNGSLRWRVSADDHPSATLTAAPVLFEGKLIVPVSSLEVLSASNPQFSCCTFRGSILALDAATGEPLWRTYTVSETPAATAKNSVGVMQFGPSGAPVWSTPAIDAVRRTAYFGAGENYSSPATTTSDAIFAISLDDGSVRWTWQATQGDAFNTSCLVPDRINCPKEDGPDLDFGAGVIFTEGGDGQGARSRRPEIRRRLCAQC